jgi:hypothetical protein
MSERMQILEEVYPLILKYTGIQPWRPSLMDLLAYDRLINMHESDYNNGFESPDFIWLDTPDHIMEKIIESGTIFDMEYGWEDFDEQVRNYLIYNDLIIDPEDEEAITNKKEQ